LRRKKAFGWSAPRSIGQFPGRFDYNDGTSKQRVGKALGDGYRDKAFLMTKIDGRDKQTAAIRIDQSLKRLQTDRIDLLQCHEVIRADDPDRIFAPGGALQAVLDAKQVGKIRYIGFTGHKSRRFICICSIPPPAAASP
jgi:predicted aldo/keto reductase-like oxidoreductase